MVVHLIWEQSSCCLDTLKLTRSALDVHREAWPVEEWHLYRLLCSFGWWECLKWLKQMSKKSLIERCRLSWRWCFYMFGRTDQAFVCFLALRRCEMEKAVKNVHLWLDGTRNNYVKTPFLLSLEGYSMRPGFYICILRDNGCRKKGKCFSTKRFRAKRLCVFWNAHVD